MISKEAGIFKRRAPLEQSSLESLKKLFSLMCTHILSVGHPEYGENNVRTRILYTVCCDVTRDVCAPPLSEQLVELCCAQAGVENLRRGEPSSGILPLKVRLQKGRRVKATADLARTTDIC